MAYKANYPVVTANFNTEVPPFRHPFGILYVGIVPHSNDTHEPPTVFSDV